MNWIVITKEDDFSVDSIRIYGKRKFHIQEILKKKVGDTLRVLVPGISKGIYQIREMGRDFVTVFPFRLEEFPKLGQLCHLHVYFALPRPQTGKKILHLAGLYGIGHLSFIFPHSKNKEFLTSPLYNGGESVEIFDGMSQSGNPHPPTLQYLKSMSDFFELISPKDTIIFDPMGVPYADFADQIAGSGNATNVCKFVFGPESGFLEAEIDRFREENLPIAKLGNVILRTEYAFHAFLHETNLILEAKAT